MLEPDETFSASHVPVPVPHRTHKTRGHDGDRGVGREGAERRLFAGGRAHPDGVTGGAQGLRRRGLPDHRCQKSGELNDVYSLVVVPIPTALPVARKDYDDAVYQTIDAKNRAAAAEVARQHKEGRPVLVGTTSVEASDAFVERLRNDYGLDCEVLSARPDAAKRESMVVAQAGRLGAVTVATNMAGRGTDIKLGGSASDVARLYVEERLRGGDGESVLKVRGVEESLLEISSATHDLVAKAREAT